VVTQGRRKRELGQNFLADRNVLDVIGRAAALTGEEVVLEVGGGLGVLSTYLAPRVHHLHVVELDARLEPALDEALAPFAHAELHREDAMTLDLAALDPPPDRLVANLPYGIAASLLLRTVEELPGMTRWLAMVQKEVGERLAAAPGSAAYGLPSVLAQLSCDVRVVRAISRTVFRPVPNVDSVLVELVRREPPAPRDVRELARAAFAHRRKALARSVALGGRGSREAVRAALAACGLPEDVRAERLAPADFRALSAALARGTAA
jgi:16S rRNA (adenine1518-N6/adenine1519-N6)-dimethyltransferase